MPRAPPGSFSSHPGWALAAAASHCWVTSSSDHDFELVMLSEEENLGRRKRERDEFEI